MSGWAWSHFSNTAFQRQNRTLKTSRNSVKQPSRSSRLLQSTTQHNNSLRSMVARPQNPRHPRPPKAPKEPEAPLLPTRNHLRLNHKAVAPASHHHRQQTSAVQSNISSYSLSPQRPSAKSITAQVQAQALSVPAVPHHHPIPATQPPTSLQTPSPPHLNTRPTQPDHAGTTA